MAIYPANNKLEARPWNPLLRRGAERIDVMAFRRDGFAGDIVISAEGLPEGVTAAPVLIGPGQSAATLVLMAGEQAADWTGTIQVVGRAKSARPTWCEPHVPERCCKHRHPRVAARFGTCPARPQFYACRDGGDTAPFQVDLGESKTWEMSRAGKLQIPVKVTRRGEIKGNMTLTALGLPANVQPQPLAFDPNTNEGKFEVQINPNAPLGSYTIYMQVQSTVGYKRDVAAAEAATKAKADIDKLAADTGGSRQSSRCGEASGRQGRGRCRRGGQGGGNCENDCRYGR